MQWTRPTITDPLVFDDGVKESGVEGAVVAGHGVALVELYQLHDRGEHERIREAEHSALQNEGRNIWRNARSTKTRPKHAMEPNRFVDFYEFIGSPTPQSQRVTFALMVFAFGRGIPDQKCSIDCVSQQFLGFFPAKIKITSCQTPNNEQLKTSTSDIWVHLID